MMMNSIHILIVGLILGLAVVAYGSHPYISDPGTLLDGFEDVNDWTVDGTGATIENDANTFKQGNQSIKLNATGGNWARLKKTNLSLDFSSGRNGFSVWFYVSDANNVSTFTWSLSSKPTAPATSFYYSPYKPLSGWNRIVVNKSDFVTDTNESWNNTIIDMKFRIVPTTGKSVSMSFDDFRFGTSGQTKVIITFDDGNKSDITKAYPIMSGNGQRGVVFAITDHVGGTNKATLADLQILKGAGWDISNHTATHKALTTVSQEEMEADIDGGYDWLVANGFGNTAKFLAYPGSTCNDAVVAKVKQRHLLARARSAFNYHFNIFGLDNLQYILGHHTVTSPAIAQTYIDEAIQSGSLLILLFHKIDDLGDDDTLTADFQAISDYLKTKQDAGELEVITFSDYYNALIGLEPEPFCLEEPKMDFNSDCKVDFKDLSLFSQSWLECNLDPKSACWE